MTPDTDKNRIGRFQLVEKLATGGMAQIFLACERSAGGFERLVVIKRLRPHLSNDGSVVDMFLKEARLVARLTHPNIVQIHELGEADGNWYIAMEYVPGSSLRELLLATIDQGGLIPINVAVGLVIQACAGAHSAHELRGPDGRELGLVHRDISPDNLMVTSDGHLKLLDFGVAKAAEKLGDQTQAGTLKGKINYMSPEQCRQEDIDRRSDVFALGIVLWELLAAKRLFKREHELAAMNAIVNGIQYDLLEFRPDVPPAIHDVVRKALSVDAAQRWQTADELRRALLAAAKDAELDVGLDEVAAYVGSMLGARHSSRQAAVKQAIERTMIVEEDVNLLDPTRTHYPSSQTSFRTMTRTVQKSTAGRLVLAALGAGVVGLGLFIAVGLVALVATQGQQGTSEPVLSGPAFVIGLPPVLDESMYLQDHDSLKQYLQRASLRPVKWVTHYTYDDLADNLVDGRVPFASLPPALYIKTKARQPAVEVLAIKRIDGSGGNDGVLLVLERSDIDGVSSLAGKTICYPDPSSTTGYALARSAIRKQGLDPDKDLTARISGNHLQAVRDLLAGRCDVAATYSGAWMGADRAGLDIGALRVLAITGRSMNDAIVAGPTTSPEDRAALKSLLLAFEPERDEAGNVPGTIERITGFAEGSDADYAALRDAISTEIGTAPTSEAPVEGDQAAPQE